MAPIFQECNLSKSLGNPFGVTSSSIRAKMIYYFYRRIVSESDRRDKEGVSLSLGKQHSVVMRVMNWLTSAAPEQQPFRRTEMQKNCPGVKPFSHGRFDTRDAGNTALSEKLSRGADRLCRATHVRISFGTIDHHWSGARSFPTVWSYLPLKRIRKTKYDLAINVSGSSAALGSFISASDFRSAFP